MRKKVITVCDECEKLIQNKTNYVFITKQGYVKCLLGGMYTEVTRCFCSDECAIKALSEKWERKVFAADL